jgi:hypothetical protein
MTVISPGSEARRRLMVIAPARVRVSSQMRVPTQPYVTATQRRVAQLKVFFFVSEKIGWVAPCRASGRNGVCYARVHRRPLQDRRIHRDSRLAPDPRHHKPSSLPAPGSILAAPTRSTDHRTSAQA